MLLCAVAAGAQDCLIGQVSVKQGSSKRCRCHVLGSCLSMLGLSKKLPAVEASKRQPAAHFYFFHISDVTTDMWKKSKSNAARCLGATANSYLKHFPLTRQFPKTEHTIAAFISQHIQWGVLPRVHTLLFTLGSGAKL